MYKLTAYSAMVPRGDASKRWGCYRDFDFTVCVGPPVLTACESVDGQQVGCTRDLEADYVDDAGTGYGYRSVWNEYAEVTVATNSQIAVNLWAKRDAGVYSAVEGFQWSNGSDFITSARQGGFSGLPFTGAKVDWTIMIQPK